MNISVVFPGQGSQSVGMLSAYAENGSQIKETYQQASTALGYDLWDIVSNGPADKLNQTEITQPAMLAADIAVLRIMSERISQKPLILAGHSLGEYSALVAAGAIEFSDAIKLVAERGRLMQNAVPAGESAMAAVLGLSDDQIIDVCKQAVAASGEVVEPVNFNSPGQVVIAGTTAGVEKANELAKEKGAKRALKLPVSVPAHSSLMKPAADELAKTLLNIKISPPEIRLIHNVDAQSHDNPDDIRKILTKQLYNPVRWVDTVKIITEVAEDGLIECGPGKVLSGLAKRINKEVPSFALGTPDGMQKFLDAM